MNILVLCTGNSARSILLESILNTLGKGRVQAFSAGSTPTGRVNPGALAQLRAVGHDVYGFQSKSWDVFAEPGAPPMDLVVTVCGNARDETCPVWPGAPLRGHWGAEDPADVSAPPEAVEKAFSEAYAVLLNYAEAFLALPFEDMSQENLAAEVKRIGEMS